MWIIIKYTMFGKIGAGLIGFAPLLFAIELGSSINALIAAIPPTAAVILGVFALRKGQKTMMVSIDGRMEELLKVTKDAALSEGKETERVEARERREEIKIEIAQTPKVSQDVRVTNTKDDAVKADIIRKAE